VSPKLVALSARHLSPEAPLPTRAVILDTAERLFAAHGVDGVAVRDLARDMGLTAPSLYNHFPGKQALYDAVLERGLRPIVDLVAEAWQPGGLRPDHMRLMLDRLVTHLARHPHLARLLQRALLDDSDSVQHLIARWARSLYHGGFAVIRETAGEAGWEPEELPHLALGLFGMVFAYFTNAPVLATIAAPTGTANRNTATTAAGEALAPHALAVQRRFLEKAVYRLLGPHASTAKSTKDAKYMAKDPARERRAHR